MADESVGKIQLDIEISKGSISNEIGSFNKTFSNSFKNVFSSMTTQTSRFVKSTIGGIANSFKSFAQVGNKSNQEVAQSSEEIAVKIRSLAEQMENATNRAELHRQKIKELQAEYSRLLGAGMGDASQAKKLQEQILKNEASMLRYANASDNTRTKIEKLEQSTQKAKNTTKEAGKQFEKAGEQAQKSGKKINGFATMLNRSFMRILRRIFIYNLIYKAIRGLINYISSALKTNKEYSNSLNQIKTNLRVAFQPIYDFILPAINALMRALATATTYIATAISAMFGKTYKQSYDAAKGLDDAKKKMDGYGKAAKKAQNALAGFDEINQLDIQDKESDGSKEDFKEFEMTMSETPNIDISGVDKFKEALQPTIESLKILGLALEPLKNFVAQGLQDFYNTFLVPVGQWTLGEGLPRFIDAITKGLMGVSWETINTSLKNLWITLTPFAINIGQGLLWFWENVLVPLGTWTMNEIVPRFLDILAEAIRVLNVTIEALKPLGLWLWENFLKPLAEWTGGIIISVLDGIKDALKGIGDWISENKETTQVFFGLFATWKATTFVIEMGKATAAIIANTAATIAGKLETIALIALYTKDAISKGLSTAATIAMTVATTSWNIVAGIATGITTAFGAAIAFLTSPIGIVIAAIGALIAIGVLLYKNWDEVKAFLLETWEKIKTKALEIWNPIKNFFADTWDSMKTKASEIWTAIKDFTVKKWTEIKTFLSDLWEGIKGSFKDVWESMKELLPALLHGILNVMKSSYEMFKNIGHDMFNMVWEGMKNIWNSITGWISEKVNWLKDKLMFWKKGQEEMASGGGTGGSSGSTAAADLSKRSEDMAANKDSIIKYANKNRINGDMNLLYDMWKAGGAPKLARGGIVDQPTLAMVGERGREAVIPFEDTSFLDALTGSIISAFAQLLPMLQGGNTSSYDENRELVFNIDGVKLIRILLPKLNDELIRMGYRPIYQYE
ncbi:hypothetical protein [Proteiniborus sp.]|uniref:hypothetical protein n=1 Tax=Proteiniborus sp. TaxID=2079015 RepID=UPI00331A9494